MKAFDPNYKLLDEMYQDNYYPAFLVDKVKDELQKVIDLLENGETDTEVVQETLDEAMRGLSIEMQFNVMIFEDQRFPVASHGGNGIRIPEDFYDLILRYSEFQR